MLRRANSVQAWEIQWRPQRLSSTFHGRDLFAPVAAKLAAGLSVTEIGCQVTEPLRFPQWPDDLGAVVYVDHYGNAITGTRASTVPDNACIQVGGAILPCASTFSDVPPGTSFWFANSCGLLELAVNGGRADEGLGLSVGCVFQIV